MIKRLIFDIDGTLITKVNFKKAILNALKKYGIYSKKNINLFLKGILEYENGYYSAI